MKAEVKRAADLHPDQMVVSNLLDQKGIRKTLYITAMKYKGCEISIEDPATSIETVHLERHREHIRSWYEERTIPRTVPESASILKAEHPSYSYTGEWKALDDIIFDILDKITARQDYYYHYTEIMEFLFITHKMHLALVYTALKVL